jgi:hypothetical protein
LLSRGEQGDEFDLKDDVATYRESKLYSMRFLSEFDAMTYTLEYRPFQTKSGQQVEWTSFTRVSKEGERTQVLLEPGLYELRRHEDKFRYGKTALLNVFPEQEYEKAVEELHQCVQYLQFHKNRSPTDDANIIRAVILAL